MELVLGKSNFQFTGLFLAHGISEFRQEKSQLIQLALGEGNFMKKSI
jgi:hypothetical protein